jgi:hypothetical protein
MHKLTFRCGITRVQAACARFGRAVESLAQPKLLI